MADAARAATGGGCAMPVDPAAVREAAADVLAHQMGWPAEDGPDRADGLQAARGLLDALQAAGYSLAPPGAVVVELPPPDGHAVPEWLAGVGDEREQPYWHLLNWSDRDRLFPDDADGVLYEGTRDENRYALVHDAAVMLAVAAAGATEELCAATPAPESGGPR